NITIEPINRHPHMLYCKQLLHGLPDKILCSLGRQFRFRGQTPHANNSYVFLTSSHFFPPCVAHAYIAAYSLPHPRSGKDPQHINGGDSWLSIGYLAGLGAVRIRQRFSILAASADCTIVQNLNLKK